MNNIDPNAVCISYTMKEKDEALVTAFRNMLKEAGIPYKCSQEPINNTVSEFEDIIGRGTIVVIFYSPDYFKSPHCMNEYALARKNEVHNNIFTVRCYKFVYNDIFRDLVRFWSAEEGDFRLITTNHTKVQEASKSHDFYLQPTHPYSIQNLSSFFPDNPYYTEKNLDVLFEKVKEKYYELAGKSKGSNIPAKSLKPLPCAILHKYKDNTFIPRDSDVKKVADKLQSKKIVNITGIGGCGKSTISILYLLGNHNKESICQKGFKDCYSHITDIIINTDDVYKEFCVRFVDETMISEYKMRQDDKQPDYKETFKSILVQLSQYPTNGAKPNLFVMDVNETADYQKVRVVIKEFCNICNKNWKLLVVSREPLCDDSVDYIDISRVDTIEFSFIKRLFVERLDIKIKQWYEKFSDDDFSRIFLKLGNLPILVKALAEFLNGEDVKKASDLLVFLGDGDLGNDLYDLQLSSVNKEGIKEEVYNKISAFLRLLSIFKNLPSDIHKHIVRYMMLWDADYYSKSFIQQVVLGNSKIDVKFNNALLDLEHKCWLDSRRNEKNVLEYKMHSLIAQSCREQVFEKNDNPEYKDYSAYLDNIDRISKLANNELSALSKSLALFDLTDNDDCLLRYAHRFMNPSIYEKALRIKVLKLYCSYNADFRDAMDKIKNIPIDRLYYNWLDRYSGYSTDIRHYKSVENEFIDNYVMNMVLLIGGTYQMGSINAANERPVHCVTLSDFYIGKTQVSQGLWKAVIGNNPSDKDKGIGDAYPVNCVSWYDCLYFIIELNKITRLKFRLPTEAEWEYAARSGGRNYTYSWTAEAEEKLKVLPNKVDVLLQYYAWNQVNSKRLVHENSKLKPNDLGIYDMSGNLWEWCQDWYDENYYQKSNGLKNPCCEIPVIEKEFPIPTRVLRGGSWDGTAWNCRVFSRGRYPSCTCVYEFGFRLAISLVKKQNE